VTIRYSHIEEQARLLLYDVWKDREILFPLGVPPVVQLLSPDVGARVCGYEYQHVPYLPSATGSSDKKAAGLLDRTRCIISVSTQFPIEEQRFTGAHELGHLVLHPDLGQRYAHRDRPIGWGPQGAMRPRQEQEADYFAACYQAPRKTMQVEFEKRFGKAPLVLNDTLAFHLGGKYSSLLMTEPPGSKTFAAAVAGAQSLDGRHFPSMAQHFGMSITAMAIRICELGLVAQ
jgi:hypothetical protein